MAGFVLRKNQRLKKLVSVRYRTDGINGEGIIKDLALSGSSITGKVPVSVGMALSLQIFLPGNWEEPLHIEKAIVKWVKGAEFGVDFVRLQPEVVAELTSIISALVAKTTWPITTDPSA
jgi:hypothetical protein